jgi:hypothetical protein
MLTGGAPSGEARRGLAPGCPIYPFRLYLLKEISSVRKRIAFLLGIGLTFVMAFGVIGSGATFTATTSASQTLTVGQMTIVLSSTTPGATFVGDVLVCPAVAIITASGLDPVGCNFSIASTGSIAPAQVNVNMTASVDGGQKYGIAPTGLTSGAAFYWLKTTPQTIGHAFGNQLPANVSVPISWGEFAGNDSLDNTDMGKTIVVSYSIEAFQ